jgi:hypothetical protein
MHLNVMRCRSKLLAAIRINFGPLFLVPAVSGADRQGLLSHEITLRET